MSTSVEVVYKRGAGWVVRSIIHETRELMAESNGIRADLEEVGDAVDRLSALKALAGVTGGPTPAMNELYRITNQLLGLVSEMGPLAAEMERAAEHLITEIGLQRTEL